MMQARIVSAFALAFFALAGTGSSVAQTAPAPPPPAGACPAQVTPSAQAIYGRLMRRFGSLGLTPDQQQRIQGLVDQFSQAHPAGSPLDPAAMRQLREQARSLLTPQQLAMLQQENEERGGEHPHRCP
jgi:Spy/CpxP family protein refolding chaperone